ncbi:hypothetical protein ACS0TY_023980 [Phlomoides rotata]
MVYPKNDALVISVNIIGMTIDRVLIDNGCYCNIIFKKTLDQIGNLTKFIKSYDTQSYSRSCHKCQVMGPNIKLSAEQLVSLYSPWSFAQWGIDLIGHMLTAPRGISTPWSPSIISQNGRKLNH